jgi:hypothetical protein
VGNRDLNADRERAAGRVDCDVVLDVRRIADDQLTPLGSGEMREGGDDRALADGDVDGAGYGCESVLFDPSNETRYSARIGTLNGLA